MGVGFFRQHLGDTRKPAQADKRAEPAASVDTAEAPPQPQTEQAPSEPERAPRQRRK